MGKKKASIIPEALFFIIVGLVVIFVSQYFEEHLLEHSNYKAFALIAGHLGIGLFAIGCLGLLLERKHWTDYFEARLKGIVSHPDFIEELSGEKLKEIEITAMRSLFKNKSIGATEGIFEYYKSHLQPALNKPYRSDVIFKLKLESKDDYLIATESFSWRCMNNNGNIQKSIHWEYGEGEIEEILKSSINLKHTDLGLDKTIINPHNSCYATESKRGFQYSLSSLDSVSLDRYSNLMVSETIIYKIRSERIIAWSFSHLSKGIDICVEYPDNFKIFVQPFLSPSTGMDIQSGLQSTNPFKFNSDSWFMEDDGIAFQLIKNKS